MSISFPDEPISEDSNLHDQKYASAFQIPELWAPSLLAKDKSLDSSLFTLQYSDLHALLEKDGQFLNNLPDDEGSFLFALKPDFVTAQTPSKPESANAVSGSATPEPSNKATDEPVEDENDPWRDPISLGPAKPPKYHSWDTFLKPSAANESNPYLSEAGSAVFDAVLQVHLNDMFSKDEAGSVIRADVYCMCLLHMATGLDSILFKFDHNARDYKPVRDRLRLSGMTVEMTASVSRVFAACGRNIKNLGKFHDWAYSHANKVRPTVLALANCAACICRAVKAYLAIPPSSIKSLLSLHSTCREPALLLTIFVEIVAQVYEETDDTAILSKLFTFVQQHEHSDGWIREFLLQIFARSSDPWLQFVQEWVGFEEDASLLVSSEYKKTSRGFVGVDEESFEMEQEGRVVQETEKYYSLNKRGIPCFLTEEDASTIFETGRSLRYLSGYHPRHPLASPMSYGIEVPKLEWSFQWENMERTLVKAKKYEEAVREAIQKYKTTPSLPESETHNATQQHQVDWGEEEIVSQLKESIKEMNLSPPALESTGDKLHDLVLAICRGEYSAGHAATFAPPLSTSASISFSHLLLAQHRLVNGVCLRMFFEEHHIMTHLLLLRRFYLFGDGVYTAKLSHALFEDEAESSERKVGGGKVLGAMGLKLGHRETWPPASYEIRLALSDILSDCYGQAERTPDGNVKKAKTLPGGLNFGIRDMSEDDLKKCMDADSVQALDFLKLQYRPPKPLDAVITPLSLRWYDKLFLFHLRVARMLSITKQLFRDACNHDLPLLAQKLRIEAQHFVSSLAHYLTVTAVGSHWNAFAATLSDIESQLRDNAELTISIDRLRQYHEKTLDKMLTASFLRSRQAPILHLVESIFSQIILFARKLRSNSRDSYLSASSQEDLKRDYRKLHKGISVFMQTVALLSEKRGYGESRKDAAVQNVEKALFEGRYSEEGGVFGQLLLRLDMGGYYTEKRKA